MVLGAAMMVDVQRLQLLAGEVIPNSDFVCQPVWLMDMLPQFPKHAILP